MSRTAKGLQALIIGLVIIVCSSILYKASPYGCTAFGYFWLFALPLAVMGTIHIGKGTTGQTLTA